MSTFWLSWSLTPPLQTVTAPGPTQPSSTAVSTSLPCSTTQVHPTCPLLASSPPLLSSPDYPVTMFSTFTSYLLCRRPLKPATR